MTVDIYVSYVRTDDVDNSVRNWIDNFKRIFKVYTGRKDLTIHMDFDNLDIERIANDKIKITENIQLCHVILSIITPSYFTSNHCGLEWDSFINKQTLQKQSIIFPVIFGELEDKSTKFNIEDKLNDEGLSRLSQLRLLSRQSINWVSVKHDEQNSAKLLKDFVRKIDVALTMIKPVDRRRKNYHIIDENIEDKNRTRKFEEIKGIIGKEERAYPDMKPVCVIYTGGTVGMIREEELVPRCFMWVSQNPAYPQ
jgi:hypothetical protein